MCKYTGDLLANQIPGNIVDDIDGDEGGSELPLVYPDRHQLKEYRFLN